MHPTRWRGRPPLKPPPSSSSVTYFAANGGPASSTSALLLQAPSWTEDPTSSSPSRDSTSFFDRVCQRLGLKFYRKDKTVPSKAISKATRVLDSVLHTLPPISLSTHLAAPRLRHRSIDHVQRELVEWKRACAISYVALDGPLFELKHKYRNKVTRVVAHTIRLLIRTGEYETAAELDRAFFTTTENVKMPFTLRRGNGFGFDPKTRRALTSNDGSTLLPLGKPTTWRSTSGVGLGLCRGTINIAWMQSLALRLEPRAFDTLDEFAQMLAMLHQEQGLTRRGVNPFIIAFLLRKAPQLERRLKELGASEDNARAEISKMTTEMRRRPELENEFVVRLSATESALDRLEKGLWDQDVFNQVDTDVRTFVSETDGNFGEELDLLQDDSPSSSSHSMNPQTIKYIQERAQILSIAIRFVIYRARLHHDQKSQTKSRHRERVQFRQSIATSAQLYEKMLQLLPFVTGSATDLTALRERQTGSLYRILWASVGTFNFRSLVAPGESEEAHDHRSLETPTDSTSFDPHTLQHALHLLSMTRLALQDIPFRRPNVTSKSKAIVIPRPDPRLIGVSTTYLRQFIYVLCVPAAPSRRSPPSRPAIRPSWIVLKRTLQTILSIRRYDLERSPHLRQQAQSRSSPLSQVSLFERFSWTHHLVRTVLLGGSNPSSSDEEPLPDRLRFFFKWVEEWCDTAGNEKRATMLIQKAMEEVAQAEFGGDVGKDVRAMIRKMTDEWIERQKKEPNRKKPTDSYSI